MKARALILLNTVGCLLLVALVVVQWMRERSLRQDIQALNGQLQATLEDLGEERERSRALEADVAMFKESLAQAGAAAREAEAELGRRAEAIEALQATVREANERIQAWEEAVAARDGRIQALEKELVDARQRLDEAVARLRRQPGR